MNECRRDWIALLTKLSQPVLENFNNETLNKNLKVETCGTDREKYKGLEILGRTLSGLAPWLATKTSDIEEETLRVKYAKMARKAIQVATDADSPDFCTFSSGEKAWNEQWLVDIAYLCLAILRAPEELYYKLPEATKKNLVKCMTLTRNIRPPYNNWVLFQTMVEVTLKYIGEDYDVVRIDYAVRQLEQWYAGDGFYNDGPLFQLDYYNSYVMQPMYAQIVKLISDFYTEDHHHYSLGVPVGNKIAHNVMRRFERYVRIQEMSVSPDGSYPPFGRSLVYRCGAFHALAQAALWKQLPSAVTPAMARVALTRVIHKTLNAKDTFDENGWLRIGVCGHQPDMAETYITTASLYMATLAFLPLGLSDDDEFWTAPDEETTWEKVFNGRQISRDHALEKDEKLY